MWYYLPMRKIFGITILAGVMLMPGILVTIVTGSILPAVILYGIVAVLVGLVFFGVYLIS